jgi:hypothetical protein
MAWSGSSIFRQLIADYIPNTASMDWAGATTVKAALYNNSITPDNDVTAANTAYNAGQWTNTNEVSDGTDWDAGGEPVTARTLGIATADTVTLDADDTPQSGASTTLADVHGCLVYNDSATTPVANQGFCYNYFGGAQSVTDGNFTIVWHANGVWRLVMTEA